MYGSVKTKSRRVFQDTGLIYGKKIEISDSGKEKP